jgi:hypothetical protein
MSGRSQIRDANQNAMPLKLNVRARGQRSSQERRIPSSRKDCEPRARPRGSSSTILVAHAEGTTAILVAQAPISRR